MALIKIHSCCTKGSHKSQVESPHAERMQPTQTPTHHLYWFLTVDRDVVDVDAEDAAAMVEGVLADPRGWVRFGYTFQRVPVCCGLKARRDKGVQNFAGKESVFHLRISTEETVLRTCRFAGLSCADLRDNVIYFNKNRWVGGSPQSGLVGIDYIRYVILHEIGHLLGRGHHSCTANENDACPVMYQQSISTGCCRPNPWPLDWE